MKIHFLLLTLGLVACGSGGSSGSRIALPKVYPPVRAATPDGLIADQKFSSSSLGRLHEAFDQMGAPTMADSVQSRLYAPGPTEILALLSDLDGRTQTLDTRTDAHPCLTGAPVTKTYSLPGGQTFTVKLQCMQTGMAPSGDPNAQNTIAFGFDQALAAPTDGGADAGGGVGSTAGGGDYFYLVESQPRGIGGLYRIDRSSEDVEAWLAVGNQSDLTQSQALMHLVTNKAAGSLEIALGGSNIGFCGAHLKTSASYFYIRGKTNGSVQVGGALPTALSCDATAAGCFATSALSTDLGGDSASCSALASSLSIGVDLDASSGGNLDFRTIYTLLTQPLGDIAAF